MSEEERTARLYHKKVTQRLQKERKRRETRVVFGSRSKPRARPLARSTTNKRKVAAAVIKNKSKAAAARELNVSPGAINALTNHDDETRSYICELAEEAAQDAVVTRVEVLRELKRLGMQNMAHYVKRVGDKIVADFSRTTYGQMAAVHELSQEDEVITDDDGRERRNVKTRVRLAGKSQALEALAKYFGITMERAPAGTAADGTPLSAPPALHVSFVEPKKRESEE